jgi:hypothetical protein
VLFDLGSQGEKPWFVAQQLGQFAQCAVGFLRAVSVDSEAGSPLPGQRTIRFRRGGLGVEGPCHVIVN